MSTRTDCATAEPEDAAVWVEEGYSEEEADLMLAPIQACNVVYVPGVRVLIDSEHDSYPDEEGTVKAVGKGTGMYAGQEVYDVLIEGTEEAERFLLHDIAEQVS